MARPSATTLESECTAEERALLMETLKNSAFSGAHLEIGTAAGGTLKEMMGQYAPDARPDFFVIDPLTYYPDQENIITRNLISAGIDPNLVTFWKGVTQDFIDPARASGQMFDFVFIDGDHRHYYVTVDLQWADCVTKGGVIALHDHGAAFPGVGWAIDTFLAHNPDFKIEARAGSLTILRRIAV
ncbi:MAG: class I SAM-dependent methyltransferase, partial [Paracoccaceae bacterium]